MRAKVVSWMMLLLLSVIWGSSYILVKKALVVFSVPEVVFFRILCGFIALLPFSAKFIKSLTLSQFKHITIIGIAGTLIPMYFFSLSLVYVDSGLDGILGALTPMYVLFFSYILFRDHVSKNDIIGVGFCVIGVLIIFAIEGGFNINSFNYYLLIGMMGNVLYGCSSSLIKKYCNGMSPIGIVGTSFFVIGIISLFFCIYNYGMFTKVYYHPHGLKSLIALIFVGIVNLGFANVLFTLIVERESPIFVSIESVLSPMIAILLGIIDGEQIKYWHIASFTLIMMGIYYISSKKSKPVHELK